MCYNQTEDYLLCYIGAMFGKLCFLIILAQTQGQPSTRWAHLEPSDLCVTKPVGAHHLIPHEYNCSLFYYCEYGMKWKEPSRCADGTHFSYELQVCDWPKNSGCILNDINDDNIYSKKEIESGPSENTIDNDNSFVSNKNNQQSNSTGNKNDKGKDQDNSDTKYVEEKDINTIENNNFFVSNKDIEQNSNGNKKDKKKDQDVSGTKDVDEQDINENNNATTEGTHTNSNVNYDFEGKAINSNGKNAIKGVKNNKSDKNYEESGLKGFGNKNVSKNKINNKENNRNVKEILSNGCPVDLYVNKLLPHETDCTKYYYCHFGEPYEVECGDGLTFNFRLQGCDTSSNSECISGKSSGEYTSIPTYTGTEESDNEIHDGVEFNL